MATVNLINKIDQLFDSVNADSPSPKRGKKYLRNMSDRSPHLEYFSQMKKFIKNCEFVGARSRAPSLDGWIQTMTGMELLWSNLKKKYPGIGSLSTRRLQQDALENCFGCIRSNCGSNYNPTVSQFVAGFKTSIISNLSSSNLSTNCETDEGIILDNLNIFLAHDSTSAASTHEKICDDISDEIINENDINENSGEMQACAYVCGFILKKIDLNCEACAQALTSPRDTVCHLFNTFKEYSDKRSLNYADINVIECVEKCSSLIYKFLDIHLHEINIKLNIKNQIKESINFSFLNKCLMHKEKNCNIIIDSIFFINIKRYLIKKNRIFAEYAAAGSLHKKINILKHI